jgi:hypothetical protein
LAGLTTISDGHILLLARAWQVQSLGRRIKMSLLKRSVCVSMGLALVAWVAIAQTTTQTSRQTGNLVGADANATGPTYQANVNITPAAQPGTNQEMYNVYWNTTIYGGVVPPPSPCPVVPPPLSPDLISTLAVALVPASSIQRSTSGGLSVDLDIGKVQLQFVASVRCIAGVCNPIPPPTTFPLKGTFTPVTTGPGAFSSSSSGNRSSINIDPICHIATSFSGNQTDTSAKFAGQIGAITVPDMPVGSNGHLHVQKGQLMTTLTCTPPPPPF